MPRLQYRLRKQKAILWPVGSTYTDSGRQKISATYQELDVQWDNSQHQMIGSDGETIAIDVAVVVAQDVAEGSIFWLGPESDLPSPLANISNLYEVISSSKVLNVKGSRYRRTLGLQRYGDKLPPTE